MRLPHREFIRIRLLWFTFLALNFLYPAHGSVNTHLLSIITPPQDSHRGPIDQAHHPRVTNSQEPSTIHLKPFNFSYPSPRGGHGDIQLLKSSNDIPSWMNSMLDKIENDLRSNLPAPEPDMCPEEFPAYDPFRGNGEKFWTCYHSLDSIHKLMDGLVFKYPNMASLEVLGVSPEGREIKALKISSSNSKNLFWIDGGMHAREWIAPAVATYIAYQFLHNYLAHKSTVDSFTWYIAPVLNVDGYEFSRAGDRLWRKTRTKTEGSTDCVGIDPNRNFNFKWMVGGSQDPCSPVFAGTAPETDPMVLALRNFIMDLKSKGNLVAFYTLHAYGQLWGCPWGWTDKTVPKSFSLLMRVANAGTTALERVHGTKYDYGTTAQLGLIGGASDDWAFAVAKVPFVYTIELRDQGEHQFALPAAQILPTAQETFEGIKASAMEVDKILKELKTIFPGLFGE